MLLLFDEICYLCAHEILHVMKGWCQNLHFDTFMCKSLFLLKESWGLRPQGLLSRLYTCNNIGFQHISWTCTADEGLYELNMIHSWWLTVCEGTFYTCVSFWSCQCYGCCVCLISIVPIDEPIPLEGIVGLRTQGLEILSMQCDIFSKHLNRWQCKPDETIEMDFCWVAYRQTKRESCTGATSNLNKVVLE